MQIKGFIKVIASALILVCLFYLSFSFVTKHYADEAKAYAKGDIHQELKYLDSLSATKVWLGYTLKECREKEINLGLDLKGGMNVILEVSIPDILKSLANNNKSENFNKAIELALKKQASSQADFLTLFERSYKEIDPNARLSTIFSTFDLKDKISLSSTNEEVMQVLRSEVDGAVSNSFNVLRTRIDRFGVVQPNIQRLENSGRILIELPGIKEPDRVRKLLQGTANLEFWETYELKDITDNLIATNTLLKDIYAPQKDSIEVKADTTVVADQKTAQESAVDSLAALMGSKKEEGPDKVSDEQREKENPLFSILQINLNQNGQPAEGPVVGVAHYSDTAKINRYLMMPQITALMKSDLSLKWGVKAIDEKGQFFQLYAIKVTNVAERKAPLEGDVITDAASDFGQYSSYATVNMQMNPDGANVWSRLTEQNIGKSIAIVLDGYVYSAPRVNDKISGGRSEITGNFTVEEAKDLANVLKSGKMPAPTRIVQEDVVGPSLGKEAIENGLISFAIAFALVLIYMIFFYGMVPGLIADAVLLLNVFLLFGILASFKAVLTLPGIAGIVLTLGMAVDTNVLIYERIREELRAGKGLAKAVAEGYRNASSAIIDANLTTIITGIVLFAFGTGPIKGFATTLIIGIVTSLITGFILSRVIFENIVKSEKYRDLSFTTNITKNFLQNIQIRFVEKRKIGYLLSGIIIIGSFISFGVRGLNQGIDFSGGRNYIISFEKAVKTEEIKGLLRDAFDGQTPGVITIKSNESSNDNRIRVSTNFRIDDNAESVDDDIHTRLYNGLKPLLGDDVTQDSFVNNSILSSQKVGPTVADDIKISAIWAIVLAILAIGLYIFIRFRNLAYSVGSIAALVHDAIFILGLYSLLYSIMPFSLEIDQAFIAAILTVIGYSINDTVIIFDRVREYRLLYPKRDAILTINDALNSTLSRTFNTTFTTFIVLFAIFAFGGESIRGFIFALLIGIIVGTYSSLFVAVPCAYEILKKDKKASKE